MPAVQETDRAGPVKIDVDQYKYGFVTEIEMETVRKGLERGDRPLHLGEEERAGVDAGMAPRCLPPLADDAEPTWARVDYPKIDFQDLYYYSAPKIDRRPEEPRRGRSGAPEATYEKLGIPLREQEILAGVEGAVARRPARASPSTRCSIRCPSSPPSRTNSPRPASSSARSRKRSASTRSWCGSTSAPWCR
jgi:Fe-S cluster assembly protein SufB